MESIFQRSDVFLKPYLKDHVLALMWFKIASKFGSGIGYRNEILASESMLSEDVVKSVTNFDDEGL